MSITNGASKKNILVEIERSLRTGVHRNTRNKFVPTGIQEPIIKCIGAPLTAENPFRVVALFGPNNTGKSATIIECLANIILDHDPEWFDYPLYKNWTVMKPREGETVKRVRIISTPKHIKDGGTLQEEFKQWFPAHTYEARKDGMPYVSIIEFFNGWTVQFMSYEMDKDSFEGDDVAITIMDEPCNNLGILDAVVRRHKSGGLLLIPATPIDAGPMIRAIRDMSEKGTEVHEPLKGITLDDNCKINGILNSKKSKAGMLEPGVIEHFKSTVSPENYDAAILGKCDLKSGTVYFNFNKELHVDEAPVSLRDPRFKEADCFCIIDPADVRYPFIQWWAYFQPDETGRRLKVLYNEWPDKGIFNKFYDESHKEKFGLSDQQLAEIIKLNDLSHAGYHIVKRVVDPRYRDVDGFINVMKAHGLTFDKCKRENIAEQRKTILQDLTSNKSLPFSHYNRPTAYYMGHCVNSIRAMERHYYTNKSRQNGAQIEAEDFKDPVDCQRYFNSTLLEHNWRSWKEQEASPYSDIIITDDIEKGFRNFRKGWKI